MEVKLTHRVVAEAESCNLWKYWRENVASNRREGMTWPQRWTVGHSLRLASSADHVDVWKRAKDLEVLPFITQVFFEQVVVGQRKLPKAAAWLLSSLQCLTILKKKIQLLADLQGQTHLNSASFFDAHVLQIRSLPSSTPDPLNGW